MQVRNDYEKGVFNGDIDVVRALAASADLAAERETSAPSAPAPTGPTAVTRADDSGAGSGGVLIVSFDGRDVTYAADELDQLQLAYAATVHKSQGSEYPAVVIPIHTQHFVMLERNLLYTAVTRARRLVVLVGAREALYIAVRNANVSARGSRLDVRLRQSLLAPEPARPAPQPGCW